MSLFELSNMPERPGARSSEPGSGQIQIIRKYRFRFRFPQRLAPSTKLDIWMLIQMSGLPSNLAISHLDASILKRWANMKDVTSVCPPFH